MPAGSDHNTAVRRMPAGSDHNTAVRHMPADSDHNTAVRRMPADLDSYSELLHPAVRHSCHFADFHSYSRPCYSPL